MRNPDEQGSSAAEWTREGRLLMAIYALYYGSGGLAVTYFPYFFDAHGLSAAAIGIVLGGRTLLGIMGQPPLSALADRLGRPRRLLAAALGIGAIAAAVLPYATGFWSIAVCIWFSAPVLAAIVPLVDAMVVRHAGVSRYGRYRLWGSIGFGVVVAGFGVAVRSITHASAGELAIFVYLVTIVLGALAALSLRPVLPPTQGRRVLGRFSPGIPFVVFVAAHGTHWAASAIVNVYLSLHLKDAGMAVWVPGIAFGVSIIGEVTAFALAGRLLRDDNAMRWLVAICLSGVVRWLVTAAAPSVGAVILIQLQHFLAFGIWYSLAMSQLGRFAPPDRRTTVQGAFAAGCFGVGSLVGSVIGGALMDRFGGAAAFHFSALLEILSLGGFVLAQRLLPPEPVDPSAEAAGAEGF